MKKIRPQRKSHRASKHVFRQRQLSALLLQLFATGLFVSSPAHARTGVVTPPVNALPVASTNAARPFVYAGSANVSTSGNAMTVTSATRTTGMNWNSFDVGSGASVTFNQPDAGSRVVNNIWSNDPSRIYGSVSSNGQVYLFNQNGILFGQGAQVNVGGLVASALSLSNSQLNTLLNNGLPVNKGDSLSFYWAGDATAFKDNARNFVAVDPGATITTPSGSKVLLLAPVVENQGAISTGQGGEAILAGGGNVLLTAPGDPNLHGLLVQVTPFKGTDSTGIAVSLDGSAANRATGTIDTSKDGVVTLAAMAVNQEGTVRAGKAVNLNGEILLVSGTNKTPKIVVTPTADTAQINWTSGFDQVSAKSDTDVTPDGTQTVEIVQPGNTLQVDWTGGFNVAQGQTFKFNQPTAGAVAYNFVNDPSRSITGTGGNSSIDGGLFADGQLFLINEKGIEFKSHANVKASNFVASALGMNPDIVANGLLNQDGYSARAFYLAKNQWVAAASTINNPDPATQEMLREAEQNSNFSAQAALAQAAFSKATVDVSKGATITTTDNGYALLIGSTISQQGTITTPKGQTLLAAGADVYLKPPYAAGLRGFTAEVNPLYVVKAWNANQWEVVDHGSVGNSGTISAPFGDISLVGFNLTQAGILQASTSATMNGSIHLVARDQVADSGLSSTATGELTLTATARDLDSAGVTPYAGEASSKTQSSFITGKVGGSLKLTAGSVTQVILDGSDGQTITSDQSFIPSAIDAVAANINVEGQNAGVAGARLLATGGNINLQASDSFDRDLTNAFAFDPASLSANAGGGVFIGSGAQLDVSGATAQKSVADLFIQVQLRGDEFAANPVQRNGGLRGKTAYVDIRDTVSIADLTGWIGKIGQTVEERAATGGTIALHSGGSVVVKQDATLDVSGGSVNYAAAKVTESRAVTAGGASYRLNDAPNGQTYTGLVNVTHGEAAYQEGKSAGTVELVGQNIALGGTLKGSTVRGDRQRNLGNPATDRYSVPYGAQLVVRDFGQHYQPASNSAADQAAAYRQAQMAFIDGRSTLADGLNAGDTAGPRLELSSSLVDAGFSRFDLQSDGRIDVPAGVSLSLAAGGSLAASGRQVYVGGSITAPSGKISLTTRDLSTTVGPVDAEYSTLVVDSGAQLSTAGQWINDYLSPMPSAQRPLALNGGTIKLVSAYDLDLRNGSRVDVSGGGQVKSNGSLVNGDAGSITLTTGGVYGGGFDFLNVTDHRDASLFLDGSLAGYALGKGGTLEIDTSKITFGSRFSQDSRDWSRSQRLAAGQVGAAFDASFLNQGGFYNFKFVGRDGVTVADGARLAPTPISWSFIGNGNYKYQASGTALDSFARSMVLPVAQRATATSLALSTTSIYYGDLTVGRDAYLGVDPLGSIQLESYKQLTVLGTLEAPGGLIRLSRPATTQSNGLDYTEQRQSESIYLGAESRLLAGGTTILDAATQNYLNAGLSAAYLRSQGLYRGRVVDGGNVELYAGQGYLITRDGSLIDVSGSAGSLSVAGIYGRRFGYATQTLGSAGGQVNLTARDGMFLDGGYRATGANGAAGGVFYLRFADAADSLDPWGATAFSTSLIRTALLSDRQLKVYQSGGGHVSLWPGLNESDYLSGNAAISTLQYNGKASIDVAPLGSAGFGSWYLASQNQMQFSGTVNATVANQLRLDAQSFSASNGASVSLTAAAAQMGNYGSASSQATAAGASPTTGAATFTLAGRDIGLVGNFSMSGFGSSRFVSSGEIHFDSMPNSAANRSGGGLYNGQLNATGEMTFAAARLSPATFSDFVVDLSADPGSTVTITRNGTPSASLLSVDGRIEFKANTILDQGTVAAPLGQIAFTSPNSTVTLDGNSITSVAAAGLLPLGETDQSGRLWNYVASYWNATGNLGTTPYTVTAPDKAISVDAANSSIQTGAKIDLSGGGDAFAWEFSPGPTGKSSALAVSATAEPGMFAILPNWSGSFAPADSQALAYYNVSNPRTSGTSTTFDNIPSLKPGDQIRLGNNAYGLTGTYTLLPASYALLPGAYLVTMKAGNDAVIGAAQTQVDGSQLVAGTRLAANADGSYSSYAQKPLTLELAPQGVVQNRASYVTTTATNFFYDSSSRLAGDAGRLSVVGRNSLNFDPVISATYLPTITTASGSQRAGKGAEVDLAALKMALVDSVSPVLDASWTTVDKDKLNALGVSSLLLGGVRSANGNGEAIDVVASDLKVVSAGDVALSGQELLFAATDTLTVAQGAKIAATGDIAATDYTVNPSIGSTSDGAFLRVAGGGQSLLTRSGSVSRSKGDLTVSAGSSIMGHSVILDATRNNTLASGVVSLGSKGGNIAIGAKRINVVGDGSTPADGLTLNNATLTAFGNPDQIRLTSYSTLDLYGNAVLGNASLNELDINAAGIAGHGGSATLQGKSIRFGNSNSTTASFTPGAALGNGTLVATADTVTFTDNATQTMRDAGQAGFAFRGFTGVTVNATQQVRFEGVGVTAVDNATAFGGNDSKANLTFNAGRLVAGSAADQMVRASGITTVSGGDNSSALTDAGGKLELQGASVNVSGRIETPAGKLTLTATGSAATDNVTVSGALLAEGVAKAFGDTYAYAPGGQIVLSSSSGGVNIQDGAQVSVSGAAGGGDAGTLSLIAKNGTVSTASSTLKGSASASDSVATQGTLTVDAGSVSLDALASAVLGDSDVHFRGKWDVRARNSDLNLSDGKTIKASDVTLSADQGNVTIAGIVDASGAKGGNIALNAKSVTDSQGVTSGGIVSLESTGKLLAYATEYLSRVDGTRGRGGNVTIGVDGTSSNIILKQNSLIDVSVAGAAALDGNGNTVLLTSAAPTGHVTLRAPRITNLADIPAQNSTSTNVSATDYVVTANTSFHAGSQLVFTPTVGNIGSTSLNVNSLGNITLTTVGGIKTTELSTAVASNTISANTAVTTVFDGTTFWVVKLGSTSYLPALQTATPGNSSSSTANVYAINPSSSVQSYSRGQMVYFSVARGSIDTSLKGAVKLNIKNQGAVPLVKNNGSGFTAANDLATGNYFAIYNGTQFVLVASGTAASPTWYAASTATSTNTIATQSTGYSVASSAMAYVPGTVVSFTADSTNAGTTTLNMNGLGTVALLKNGGQAVASGDIQVGEVVTAVYDGTGFQITSVSGTATSTPDYGTRVAIAPIAGTIKGTSSSSPVVVDAFKTYNVSGDAVVDVSRLALWQADNLAFMNYAPTIAAGLTTGRSDGLSVSVRPGIDLRTTGNMTVGTAIDFNSSNGSVTPWHYGSAALPGSLTLRAGGNLNINAVITDGFTASSATGAKYLGTDRDGRPVFSGDSWNYRFTAGADLSAANADAVLPTTGTTGNIQINAPLVRTGAGSITMTAQGNIGLADGTAVYSAGTADALTPSNFAQSNSSVTPDPFTGATVPFTGDQVINGTRNFYPTHGGDVRVSAGGNISETTQGTIGDWLVRFSSAYNNTQWYPRIASFRNGFATFGGGDLMLTAGADISNVTAAIPTNGRVPGVNGQARADLAQINGGGNLSVRAGGSILGGTYYAENGLLDLNADKKLSSAAPAGTRASDIPLYNPQIALGDTVARIVAQQGIGLANIFNPLSTTPAYKDSSGVALTGTLAGNAYKASIGTYTEQTQVDMAAVNGPVSLAGSGMAPSRVKVATLNEDTGDISVSLTQLPGHEGQLDLLAAKGLQLGNITQYDTPADKLPSMSNPLAYGVNPFSLIIPSLAHSITPWHATDTQPSRMIALNGDIAGPGIADIVAQFNEPVQVSASGDIRDGVSIVSQHLNAGDVTSINAGGSIVFRTDVASRTAFQVDGPGQLNLTAGKNVDLGSGTGIVTAGNLNNPNLPEGGASVSVLAGSTAADYSAFLNYVADGGHYKLAPEYHDQFVADLAAFVTSHPQYAGSVSSVTPTVDQYKAALQTMPDTLKLPFLRKAFYTLLDDYGARGASEGASLASGASQSARYQKALPFYLEGSAMAAALFPSGSYQKGNIDLFYSQIKTEQGGDIHLLAPGGSVTVGIASPSANLSKKGSDQGLFTIRGGDIDAYVGKDFLVNQSRVMAIGDSGDIMAWADQGNIDLGKGAKTVSATPPPVLVIRNGQIVLDTSNSVAGSGANATNGAIGLYTPHGSVDFGDAGATARSITVGGSTVKNSDNVNAGSVVGAPPPAPAAPATTSTPSAATDANKAPPPAADVTQTAKQGILTVEVLASGDPVPQTLSDPAAPSPSTSSVPVIPGKVLPQVPSTGKAKKKNHPDE